MSKSKKSFNDEKKKEPESPSHKKRREQDVRLRNITRHGVNDEDEFEEIERFEPVRRKR